MNQADQEYFDELIETCGRAVAFEGVSDRPRPFLTTRLMAEAAWLLQVSGAPSDVAAEQVGELIFARADELRRLVNAMVREAITEAVTQVTASETKH